MSTNQLKVNPYFVTWLWSLKCYYANITEIRPYSWRKVAAYHFQQQLSLRSKTTTNPHCWPSNHQYPQILQLITRFHKLPHVIQKGQPSSSQMASLPSQNKVPTESPPSKLSLVMQHPVTASVLLIHSQCWGSTLFPSAQNNEIASHFQPSEAATPCFFTEHSKHLPIVAHSLKPQNLVIKLIFKTQISVKVQNHFQKEVYSPWEKIHTHSQVIPTNI